MLMKSLAALAAASLAATPAMAATPVRHAAPIADSKAFAGDGSAIWAWLMAAVLVVGFFIVILDDNGNDLPQSP